jgi:hypothetical protein
MYQTTGPLLLMAAASNPRRTAMNSNEPSAAGGEASAPLGVEQLAPVALIEPGQPPTGQDEPEYHDEDDDDLTLRDDEEGDQ